MKDEDRPPDLPQQLPTAELSRTAEELRALASQLQSISRRLASPDVAPPPVLSDADLAILARAEFEARRQREKEFPVDILGEPCWDLLLDLFERHCRDETVSVKQAILAAGVPQTTGLRHVQIMVERGYLIRTTARHDARVVELSLTEQAVAAMRKWLSGGAALWRVELYRSEARKNGK
ncbi:MAG: hypothetical protein H6918_05215 [Sphingomonadaceae bacterium]|nr:hypothetical protein [Sphingomonadaceae bacterium]